jgi:hypothetical protein
MAGCFKMFQILQDKLWRRHCKKGSPESSFQSGHIWGAKDLHVELSGLLVDRAAAWTCGKWSNTAALRLSPRRSSVTGGWLTEPPMTFQGEFLGLSPRRALLVNSAPQRRRSSVEGGSTYVVVGETWKLPSDSVG